MLKLVINRWNIVHISWVKNVNKLRVNGSTTGGILPTVHLNTLATQLTGDVQLLVIPTSVPSFTQVVSTLKIRLSYLLPGTYTHYPQPLLLEPIKKI